MGGSKYIVALAFFTASFSVLGQQNFIITFNTEAGDPQSKTITLPIYDGTYNVEVDMDGDGVYEHKDASSKSLENLVGLQTITFSTPGIYQVRIYPGSYNYGNQLRVAFDDTDSAQKLIRIDDWGTDINWTSMRNAFNGCTNLTISSSAGAPNLSNVTDMAFMFANATSLHEEDLSMWNISNVTNMKAVFLNATSFNGNISTWNTNNVTSTEEMFDGATTFNGNLNDWNISKVANMTRMFYNASSFNQDLDMWNVSNVQNFRYMFYEASSFNRSISNWNTQRATTMSHMFFNATKFNQDISDWYIPNVHNMTAFLSGTSNFSVQNYDKLLIGWSTLNTQSGLNFGAPPTSYCNGKDARAKLIEDYYWNISDDTGLDCRLPEPLVDFTVTFNTVGSAADASIILPISDGTYDVDINNDGEYDDKDATGVSLQNLTGTKTITFTSPGVYTIRIRPASDNPSNELRINFGGGNSAHKLTSIERWGDRIVWTSMQYAFRGCVNMNISASAGAPNLSKVTNMGGMFLGASTVNQNLNAWNVSNVNHMSGLFLNATLFNGNVSTWNTSNVTVMQQVFANAPRFNQDISNWDTSKVTNMSSMFFNVSSHPSQFNQDISSWNTENVTTMRALFYGASSFNQDISNWNTQKVTNMSFTFFKAAAFDHDIGNWNVSKATNLFNIFKYATGFSSENYDKLLTAWSQQNVKSNVNFGAPSRTYCDGIDGRNRLINTYGWRITGDVGIGCQLSMNIKAFLQGAHHEPSGMMRDDLRAHIPTTSPYSDGAIIKPEVLNVEGNDAIVDWVYIELRDKEDIKNVVYGSSALLQRDGDVVNVDGTTTFSMMGAFDHYYVSMKHRTHLAIATHLTMNLNSTATVDIDFSDTNNVRGGSTSLKKMGAEIHALMCGDINGDGQINTEDLILGFNEIGKSGYSFADINMDGQVQTLDMIHMLVPLIGNGVQF